MKPLCNRAALRLLALLITAHWSLITSHAAEGGVIPVVKHGTDTELSTGTDTRGRAWSAEQLATIAGGSGDVGGPAAATDNAIARFDATTGKLVQNSVVTIADTTGDIVTPGSVTVAAEAYSASFDGSYKVVTQDAFYDKIEAGIATLAANDEYISTKSVNAADVRVAQAITAINRNSATLAGDAVLDVDPAQALGKYEQDFDPDGADRYVSAHAAGAGIARVHLIRNTGSAGEELVIRDDDATTVIGTCYPGSWGMLVDFAGSGAWEWNGGGGSTILKNATSGTVTIQPVAGALGTSVFSVPAATDTAVGKATTDSLTNKTLDASATGNVVKMWGYLMLTHPHSFGAGVTAQTTATSPLNGQAQFAAGTDEATNYVEYDLLVPPDLDTAVDLTGTFHFVLGAADTADHDYVLSFDSVAASADKDGTLGDAINLTYSADASGASDDAEVTGETTLTGWRSAMTAGQRFVVRLARDGDDATNDASTQVSYSGPLIIKYGISQ